jgi:hypothetical protein
MREHIAGIKSSLVSTLRAQEATDAAKAINS